MDEPRSLAERKADALAKLTAREADMWVSSASAAGAAHLVPLSFAWDGERVVLATEASAITTRNAASAGRARLGLGTTRDVVMIDASLDGQVAVGNAEPEIGARYAEQADWDPREAVGDFVYLLLRPVRMQVWREANEIAGRTVMRDGVWLA